jgi:hypothetical protein
MEILGDSLPARTANLVPPEMLPELLMQLAPLLEKHSLGEVVSYSGFAERTFRWRLHW